MTTKCVRVNKGTSSNPIIRAKEEVPDDEFAFVKLLDGKIWRLKRCFVRYQARSTSMRK